MTHTIRLHILNCDPMKPELIERFGNYPAMFAELFATAMARQTGECELLIDSSDAFATPPPSYDSLQNADALLITGSAASVYEEKPWILNLQEIVRRWVADNRKLIGICFGHQLVAEALGGKVAKSVRGWGIGRRELPIQHTAAWMGEPAPESIALLYSHQDQVEQLPANATVIVGDSFCPVAGFTLGEHVMTLQGHPEFSVAYLSEIIQRRKRILGEEKAQQALQSSKHYTEEEASVAPQWMVKFLCGN